MRLILCAVFCFATQSGWALDSSLVGRWSSGTGADTAHMEIKADGSGSNVTPGLILIFPSASDTAADMERAQKQGVQEPSISMAPTGTICDAAAEGGAGKLIDVAGTMEQTQVKGLLGAYLRTEGTGGLAVLAATTPEKWAALQPFAEQVVRGVKFFQPQISDRLLKARQALAGHSLVTSFNNSTTSQNSSGYYTGTATNSFRAWHCCGSGRCRYEGSRSSSFRGGGIISSSESSGGPSDGNWELQLEGNSANPLGRTIRAAGGWLVQEKVLKPLFYVIIGSVILGLFVAGVVFENVVLVVFAAVMAWGFWRASRPQPGH